MSGPVIVLGGGGHARVIIDALRLTSHQLLGIVDPNMPAGDEVCGLRVLGGDEAVANFDPNHVQLVNAIGSSKLPILRRRTFEYFVQRGYTFASVIHPSAVLARDVIVGAGVQVMAGAVVQAGATLGDNVLINTRASVDHGCWIGSHCHVAPGATVCGDVHIGDGSLIGSGATVIQGLEVGSGVVVGAGSVVVRGVAPNTKVVGVPARVIRG